MLTNGINKSGSSSNAVISAVGFSRVGQSFIEFITTGITMSIAQPLPSLTFSVMVVVPHWSGSGVKVMTPLAFVTAESKSVAVCVKVYSGVLPSASLISAP